MAKKVLNLIILLPLGILLVIFCVANRQMVGLSFNPFRPEDQVLSLSAPLFVIIFLSLLSGILIGSGVTWFNQGKYRKRARIEAKEAVRWHEEANRNKPRDAALSSNLPAAGPGRNALQ